MTDAERPAHQDVFLVAVCAGPRCQGLHRLRSPDGAEPDVCGPLREVVRRQPHGVLMTVGCLGPCARGSLAAFGDAVIAGERLNWSGSPLVAGGLDDPARMAALVDRLEQRVHQGRR